MKKPHLCWRKILDLSTHTKKIYLRTHHKKPLQSLKPSCYSTTLFLLSALAGVLLLCAWLFPRKVICRLIGQHPHGLGPERLPEHHCWNLLTLHAESMVCSSRTGFHYNHEVRLGTHLPSSYSPITAKAVAWMRVWGGNTWAMVSANKEHRLCIHIFRKPMTKEC